jgi:hypothetical protein
MFPVTPVLRLQEDDEDDVPPGGCDCDCAYCDQGSHCGEAENGCRFYE